MHAARHLDRSSGAPLPTPFLTIDLTAVDERLAHFFDEKRIAFGFTVNLISKSAVTDSAVVLQYVLSSLRSKRCSWSV
jgi:hypothetical protein